MGIIDYSFRLIYWVKNEWFIYRVFNEKMWIEEPERKERCMNIILPSQS